MTPAWSIGIGGSDATRRLDPYFASLRITLSDDRESDSVEIELTSDSGVPAAPSRERSLRVRLGFVEDGLIDQGTYYHDETSIDLVRGVLTIRATAADLRKAAKLKTRRTAAWEATTLGDLIEKVATRHNLEASVDAALAAETIARVDQTDESDLHLVHRLAERYGATAKVDDKHLVFVEEGTAASGRTFAPLNIALEDVSTARLEYRGRPSFARVQGSYWDIPRAEPVKLDVGSGDPVYRLRDTFDGRAACEAACRAKLKRLVADTAELEISMPGVPTLAIGNRLSINWGTSADGTWLASRIEHRLSKGEGFVTALTAKRTA